MFEKHIFNMKPIESNIRIIVATLFFVLSVINSSLIFAIMSLLLFYTGFKKFCFIYYLLSINKKYSLQNYYLSFLPKYNTSAVFIFSGDGKILFKNSAASKVLAHIELITDMNIQDYKKIIEKDIADTIMFEYENKNYQVELQGISNEKFLLVYLTDVTELVELNNAIEETQREVIYAMGEIGETRSKETGNHVKRVALYSKLLAELYGLGQEESDKLQMASPMHDIGKVGIPDAILNAPRKLTLDEFKIMQTHATLGFEMLKTSNKPILKAAAIVANEHHEKWDGSGYPNATSGENIHIYGRITAVADVFDALGSERVYKKAWPLEDILELFEQESGKHFDPKLIELFIANLDEFLKIRDSYRD